MGGEGDILNFGIWDLGCFLPGKSACGRREIFARSDSLNENFENWEALISVLLLYTTSFAVWRRQRSELMMCVHVEVGVNTRFWKRLRRSFPKTEIKRKKKESIMADKLRGFGGRRIAFRFPCIDLLLDLVLPDAKKIEKGKEWRYKILFPKVNSLEVT